MGCGALDSEGVVKAADDFEGSVDFTSGPSFLNSTDGIRGSGGAAVAGKTIFGKNDRTKIPDLPVFSVDFFL